MVSRETTEVVSALEELDRVLSAGVWCGVVLAEAGYGMSADFGHTLSARNLT